MNKRDTYTITRFFLQLAVGVIVTVITVAGLVAAGLSAVGG